MASAAATNSAARQTTLVNSLRVRYAAAVAAGDADAKLALFKEATYLGIKPEQVDQPTVPAA